MDWLRDIPIRKKLTLVILAICTVVLTLACASLALFEVVDFRRAIVRDATVLADILGKNTRAALAFQDEAAATDFLLALQSEPNVLAAGLYDRGGELFAGYVRGNGGVNGGRLLDPPARTAVDGHAFLDGHLAVFRPILLDAKRVGTIGLFMDLERIYSRMRLFGGIALATLIASLLLAILLSARLQGPISQPILDLARTAQTIAERGDYSVRAPKHGDNEVGALTDAFNHMVAGIDERERALRGEIAERREAEMRVQAQLARLDQLHHITRATGERQDLGSIFQVVIRSLEDHFASDYSCICLHEPGRPTLAVVSVGPGGEAMARTLGLGPETSIPIDLNGLARCVRGHLVYEPDVTRLDFPFPRRLADAGLRAFVAAPLLVESTVFGVLIVCRRAAGSFSSGECEFLRQLSEHVALAAHQAQLYQALQRAYDDLRQSQQAVLQQERLRALGQMASGIAHDINNAISPVTLYTEALLETETGLTPRARDYLTTIQHAVEDVAQTVSRMREFYRPGEASPDLRPLDLNRLVPQVVNLTRGRWSDLALKGGVVIDMRTELAPDLPPVLGVESEIREALTNLVLNAADAMPAGGSLIVRTARCGPGAKDANAAAAPQVLLEVVDSGVGMDEETRRRCLEPFFTTKGERGTGLGLAMVYGIVRRHGADIAIDSEPGRGTAMRIFFPASETCDAAGPVRIDPLPIPQRLRLLVVDDDPIIIKSLRDTLGADGHEITAAAGGQAGIDAFRAAQASARPFSLVLTDLGMPHVDGRKVAAAIKAAAPTTPVILLTGWGERMVAEGDIPPHVDQVLPKPPRLGALRAAFARLIRSSHT